MLACLCCIAYSDILSLQGSGWGWLAWHPHAQKLVVATTANHDPLKPTTSLVPLLGIDVWEHAYVSTPASMLCMRCARCAGWHAAI